MKLFTKADNTRLFANYAKGSDMANQNVVVKIFNPYGRGTWFIMNSDPNDPDYLWGIVDLGYGAEVGSISRSDLENFRNRMGFGFERDTSFSPKNAREVFKGLQNGEFFKGGGKLLTTKQRYIAELKGLTGLQQKAIEDYIEENNLTSDEVLHIVIGLGRKQISRSDVSTAIVGTKNNVESKKLLAFAMSNESLKAEYGAFMDSVYDGGGNTQKGVDLFEDYKNIPPKVQAILDKYEDSFMDGDYDGLGEALKELNNIGYTFEYDLDGQAYDLRKIGQKGKSEYEEYKLGGKTTFAEKSSAIAKNFVGKAVEPKYQKEYGKRYDAKEAKEVGNKIAGKQKASYDKKNMKTGGATTQGSRMKLLTQKAKDIRKSGEKWSDALKRASAMMK